MRRFLLILVTVSALSLLQAPASWAQSLVAAVLPSSRSVQVGVPATAFATIINSGTATATGCTISPVTTLPAAFIFQTTDPATNAITGTPDTPVDIPVGVAQSFVFAFTPTAPISPTEVELSFDCTNADLAPITAGLNTLLLSASDTPIPDIVALAATLGNDGIVNIPGGATGTGAFSVATVNVGTGGSVTASADVGNANVVLQNLLICETNPTTGSCLSPLSQTVTTTIGAGETPTFAVFAAGDGNVPFDPAANRVFVRFEDNGGVTRGSTSVAMRTPVVFSPTEGASGTRVLIKGSGFSASSAVTFGGSAGGTVFVSDTELVAFVPFDEIGAALSPMAPGAVNLEIDGVAVGSFIVETLPDNPNAPGTVWMEVTGEAATEFSSLRPQLETQLDTLLGIATDPALRDLLAATRAALPALQDQFDQASALVSSLSPELLGIIERLLLSDSTPGGPTLQLEPAVCTTAIDRALCDRKALEVPIQQTQKITKLCGLVALGALVVSGPGAAVIGGMCLSSSIVLDIYKVVFVPEVVGIEIVGPSLLRTGDIQQYEANVTIQSRASLELLISKLIEKILSVFPGLVTGPLQTLTTEVLKSAGVKFPELVVDTRPPGPISAENLSWGTFSRFLTLLGPGQVKVSESLAKVEHARLFAFLNDDLKVRDESERVKLFESNENVKGSIVITLVPSGFALLVGKGGTGGGTVTSFPPGINCGTDCSELYDRGTVVTLTATPDPDSTFTGWSGACAGTGSCVVTIDADKAVTGTFNKTAPPPPPPPGTFALLVGKGGTGSGTVTSSPLGINCGTDCSEIYDRGTVVTLTATPDPDSTFTGWSGACTGTGSCVVTMDADKAVTATFDLAGGGGLTGTWDGTYNLTVNVGGFCPNISTVTHSGSITATFSQTGGAITGTATITGVKDIGLDGSLNCIVVGLLTFTGSVSGSISGSSVTMRIDFGDPDLFINIVDITGTLSGNMLSGTLSGGSGAGSLSLTKR